MEDKFKDFYDTLKENLAAYNGEYASFIDEGPNLFKLLCDVLDQNVTRELRLDVCAAIAYYVLPMDVIPEQIYGAYGYIDDIFMSVYALQRVADEYGFEFLQDLWELETNIEDVMNECYEKSIEVLEENDIKAILTYTGLE
ncbi:YkvA family protein [Methanobrevibacter millerae]|uniref:Uncharacterized membrane protein YkvA, DUF1232 family n=1 Tax=Methanobrevibacter millerae TaxID=230361 RepID=A0A1G5WGX1_9EURY|nr:YkvA family protein [Methanobrevibacter millerae]SDA57144.1 Uncharacterized membrane protein YkvA, DUF1232 family [Methanobrevibacter millerae]